MLANRDTKCDVQLGMWEISIVKYLITIIYVRLCRSGERETVPSSIFTLIPAEREN